MDPNRLLESINQNINEGIYRGNSDGIIYVNKAFAKMFGYEDEAEFYKHQPLIINKNSTSDKRAFSFFENSKIVDNQKVTLVKKNGEEFTGLISS
ncbi:MAG: PAS domain-containing protein, partial [Bacteroidota bacterium]